MPESKKKTTKAVPKVSKELKECQEAVVYLLEELKEIKSNIEKVMNRMGL
tara:strand:+ start:308 stop:457 length:150 start_codon:yes stop_codon:yes gene_type:complete